LNPKIDISFADANLLLKNKSTRKLSLDNEIYAKDQLKECLSSVNSC